MTSTQAYQQIRPCVDDRGHRFEVSTPAPGQWGNTLTYCSRCGKFRYELNLPRPKETP